MTKSPPRVQRRADLQFTPRFEYGDVAEVAGITGPDEGTELGTGMVRMTGAEIPWTIKYDEVILILEGALSIDIEGEILTARAMEAIWLPAGTELVYRAEYALMFYAIHPANWAEKG